MIRKAIALILAMVVLQVSGAGVRSCAQDAVPDVRGEVMKAHTKKHNVDVKLPDGRKLTGKVTDFKIDGFVLRDKSGAEQSFSYADVVQVSKHHSTGKKILIGVGLGAAFAGLLAATAILRQGGIGD